MDYETQEKLRPTKEEREAKKEQARKDAEKALIALKKADEAFRATSSGSRQNDVPVSLLKQNHSAVSALQ